MKTKPKFVHPTAGTRCKTTRLAESSVAAVDVCDCGMMQVHIGPITLRLAQCAVAELLSTLGQAVAMHAATRARVGADADAPVIAGALSVRGRGEA